MQHVAQAHLLVAGTRRSRRSWSSLLGGKLAAWQLVMGMAVCLLAITAPRRARAELNLMQKPAAMFQSQDGAFAAKLPPAWMPKQFVTPGVVEFHVAGNGAAWVQVRRTKVAPTTMARQLLLRARDTRLSSLPHFRELNRREIMIDGQRAAVITGDFWYQGNAQYPRAVEEMFMVVDGEAFEVHFECFEPLAGEVHAELNQFYSSFVTYPGRRVSPENTKPKMTDDQFLDSLPF